MVQFLSELSVTPVSAHHWQLNKFLVCKTAFGRINVPKGFVTDGASVPRVLWALYPPMDGDYDAAAVLHDFIYQTGHGLTRAEADSLLLDGMRATNTARRKRCCIYLGVRLGGWVTWRRYRRKEK